MWGSEALRAEQVAWLFVLCFVFVCRCWDQRLCALNRSLCSLFSFLEGVGFGGFASWTGRVVLCFCLFWVWGSDALRVEQVAWLLFCVLCLFVGVGARGFAGLTSRVVLALCFVFVCGCGGQRLCGLNKSRGSCFVFCFCLCVWGSEAWRAEQVAWFLFCVLFLFVGVGVRGSAG